MSFFDEMDAEVTLWKMTKTWGGRWHGVVKFKDNTTDLELKVRECQSPTEVLQQLEKLLRKHLQIEMPPSQEQKYKEQQSHPFSKGR